MYFIVKLAELSKTSGKAGEIYKREHKATVDLAKAVGQKLHGQGVNLNSTLTKGCLLRLKQLHDRGYLAVKRSKGDTQRLPARYTACKCMR